MSYKRTSSGVLDAHADCACRTTTVLCPRCYSYGLRILLSQGLGRELARIDRKLTALTFEQRTYMRWNHRRG